MATAQPRDANTVSACPAPSAVASAAKPGATKRIRARLDFEVRWNEVVCCMSVRGSVHDHADQLSALSEELGIRLIAIDEDLHVESAGL